MNERMARVWGEQAEKRLETGMSGQAHLPASRSSRAAFAIRMWAWRLAVSAGPTLDRALDVAGAAIGLLVLSPLMAATWALIRLEDGGPAFYTQRRVGRDGVLFSLFKFRSMVSGADALKNELSSSNESAGGVLFKMRRDPRITRVGAVIRKLSIDELPQLFNVLRGDMALVGPRPALPDEVARYSQAERARLSVKPGITCLWQVSGRSDIDFHGQVKLDVRYIRERSLITNLVILARTVPAVLSARGAY